jgi:hypothetical protein
MSPKTHTIQLRDGKGPAEHLTATEFEAVSKHIVGFKEHYDVTVHTPVEKPAPLAKPAADEPKTEKTK